MLKCPSCENEHNELPNARRVIQIFADGKGYWKQAAVWHAPCPETGVMLVIRDIHSGGKGMQRTREVRAALLETSEPAPCHRSE